MIAILALIAACARPADAPRALRIGYFHAGRNAIVYRALDDGAYDRAGVAVVLRATRQPTIPTFVDMPATLARYDRLREMDWKSRYLGRTTAAQMADELRKGGLDCAAMGESTFLLAVDQGLPWVGVARLGQDDPERPGMVVVVRAGLELDEPADFVGLRVGARDAGPYERVLVREFLESEGAELSLVDIEDDVAPDAMKARLRRGEFDLALLPARVGAKEAEAGQYQPWPGFRQDFVEPGIGHSLVVCSRMAIGQKREQIVRFLAGTKRRIDYELQLPAEARGRWAGRSGRDEDDVLAEDLELPRFSDRPLVDEGLLSQMQALLVEHGIVEHRRALGAHVDNSLAEEALARVAAEGAVEPYPGARAPGDLGVEPGRASSRLLAALDVDGDGFLDVTEFAWITDDLRLRQWDLDHDQRLDARELERLLAQSSPAPDTVGAAFGRRSERARADEEEGESEEEGGEEAKRGKRGRGKGGKGMGGGKRGKGKGKGGKRGKRPRGEAEGGAEAEEGEAGH